MQKIAITLIDDLDGKPIDDLDGGTVSFMLDGTYYEIDLAGANAAALRQALAPYIESGRKSPRGYGARAAKATGHNVVPNAAKRAAIREWARSRGDRISPRGRIAQAIIDAYDKEHA